MSIWQWWWFKMSVKLYCFFNLGLKRRVWNALCTTLGRCMGFLCSRSRLLVDPLLFFFLGALPLAHAGTFCWDASVTRGTRITQLEWRSCSLELVATERGRERYNHIAPHTTCIVNSSHCFLKTLNSPIKSTSACPSSTWGLRAGSGSQLAMTVSKNSRVSSSLGIGGAEGLALEIWFKKWGRIAFGG